MESETQCREISALKFRAIVYSAEDRADVGRTYV
jgi:hypothetical protein